MAIDPEILSWLKTLAASGLSGGLVAAAVRSAWKQFVVRPVERAEREAEQWKKMWKDEQHARDKRILDAETALLGRPSTRPYRDEQPTMNMLVESVPKQQRDAELQSQMLADRARDLPPSLALEALAPNPSPRDHIRAAGGGKDVYEERRRRQLERGDDTPTAFKPEAIAELFPTRTGR